MTRWMMLASVATLAISACNNDAAEQTNNVAMPAGENMAEGPADAAARAMSGQAYVDQAGASDLYEIESARLAVEKSQRAEVRELAQMILADHQRSSEQLIAAAGRAEPPLTAQPRLTAEQQANLEALRAASGAAFDAEYLRQQIAAHEQALALVESYSGGGEVAPLREHATTVMGPIRQHLERARSLSAG